MTEIYSIDIGKDKIAAMPLAERRLLLLLGHAANEINVLQRFILISGQGTPSINFVDLVQAGQTFILMRVLIGKLHEAWNLFDVRVLSDHAIKSKYLPRLRPDAQHALSRLQKHFGRESPITDIRNAFSFHYRDDADLVERSFQDIPANDAWSFYLSNMQGNCFYYASELVVAGGVIKLAEPTAAASGAYLERSARGFERLCKLTVGLSGRILSVFGGLITELATENFRDVTPSSPTPIPNAPVLRNMEFPFFIDEAEFTKPS